MTHIERLHLWAWKRWHMRKFRAARHLDVPGWYRAKIIRGLLADDAPASDWCISCGGDTDAPPVVGCLAESLHVIPPSHRECREEWHA